MRTFTYNNSLHKIYSKYLPLICSLFFGTVIYLLLSPIKFYPSFFIPLNTNLIIAAGWVALILNGIVVLKLTLSNSPVTIQISVIDALLGAYTIYMIVHLLILKPTNPDPIFLIESVSLIFFYFNFRQINGNWKIVLPMFIPLAAIHQVWYGIAKQTGWFAPGFGLSDLKGNYLNQGPFAGFIAVALIIAVGLIFLFLYNRKRFKLFFQLLISCILTLTAFTMLATLIKTNSRASWLGALGALSWLLFLFHLNWFRSHLKIMFHKSISFTVLLSSTLILIYYLYQYKKDSADGRLLIWQVTLKMIAEKPFLGYGINEFQSNYMHHQAKYLRENADDSRRYLADNILYAFNEGLRITSEQGILGFIIALLAVGTTLVSGRKERPLVKTPILLIARSGMISLLIFGLFSYPGDVFTLKFCFILFAAIIAGEQKDILAFSTYKHKAFTTILLLVILFLTHTLYKVNRAFQEWNKAFTTTTKDYVICAQQCNNVYPFLYNNGEFLTSYGKILWEAGNYKKAVTILNEATGKLPTTLVYETLGQCYQALEMYEDAEETWEYASAMVPARFTPGYMTVKMYYERGLHEKAAKLARSLLLKSIKVNSPAVYRMRDELEQMAIDTLLALPTEPDNEIKLNTEQFTPNLQREGYYKPIK